LGPQSLHSNFLKQTQNASFHSTSSHSPSIIIIAYSLYISHFTDAQNLTLIRRRVMVPPAENSVQPQASPSWICGGERDGGTGFSKYFSLSRFAGPTQHCSLKADCTLAPEIVPSFISRGAPHQAARGASISEGRKLNTRVLPATRNLP
jgi:hypothetical protein